MALLWAREACWGLCVVLRAGPAVLQDPTAYVFVLAQGSGRCGHGVSSRGCAYATSVPCSVLAGFCLLYVICTLQSSGCVGCGLVVVRARRVDEDVLHAVWHSAVSVTSNLNIWCNGMA